MTVNDGVPVGNLTYRVARRLRHARRELDLSQEQVGHLLIPPVTGQTISVLERGLVHIDVEKLAQFCRIYQWSVADFINDHIIRQEEF